MSSITITSISQGQQKAWPTKSVASGCVRASGFSGLWLRPRGASGKRPEKAKTQWTVVSGMGVCKADDRGRGRRPREERGEKTPSARRAKEEQLEQPARAAVGTCRHVHEIMLSKPRRKFFDDRCFSPKGPPSMLATAVASSSGSSESPKISIEGRACRQGPPRQMCLHKKKVHPSKNFRLGWLGIRNMCAAVRHSLPSGRQRLGSGPPRQRRLF